MSRKCLCLSMEGCLRQKWPSLTYACYVNVQCGGSHDCDPGCVWTALIWIDAGDPGYVSGIGCAGVTLVTPVSFGLSAGLLYSSLLNWLVWQECHNQWLVVKSEVVLI